MGFRRACVVSNKVFKFNVYTFATFCLFTCEQFSSLLVHIARSHCCLGYIRMQIFCRHTHKLSIKRWMILQENMKHLIGAVFQRSLCSVFYVCVILNKWLLTSIFMALNHKINFIPLKLLLPFSTNSMRSMNFDL